MSRYMVPALDPVAHAVAVGWDNPLETFFASVEERKALDETIILQVGVSPKDKVLDVKELARRLAPYAMLPDDVATKLEQDYTNRTQPTRLQRRMRAMFEGEAHEP